MESLEDDFKSLLIGNEAKPKHNNHTAPVPSNSAVELRSDEVEIHSDVEVSSFEEQGWCNITRNSDLNSVISKNKSLNVNLAEGIDLPTDDTNMIRCENEIIPGPISDGYWSYRSSITPMNESSEKVFTYQKKPRSKRARLMRDEDNYGKDLACAQCGIEYGGFQCNKNTLHLQCYSCGGMMPMQTNIDVPQHCRGCYRPFCGAYWHSQQVTRKDSYSMCAPETFKPIGERTITRIPYQAHGWNQHEQDITERCIQQMEVTLQDVVSEWVTKLNDQEIDCTRMPLNHAEMITSETHICNDCFDELVSFLLYWFRVSLPKDHLPEDAAQREDCWYGYDCRTQNHNDNHARKRNHVCPPTIGARG
ncbi:hypothetical protein M8C21_012468, partial [Ambrosia artemisiifolia]